MTQHHDLGVLRRLAAAQYVQPAKGPDDDEVQKSDRHSPRSCLATIRGDKLQVTTSCIEFWSGTRP